MKQSVKLVIIYFILQILGTLTIMPFNLLYHYFTEGAFYYELGANAMHYPLLLGMVYMGTYLWKNKYLQDNGRKYNLVSASFLFWSLLLGISGIFIEDFLVSFLTFLPDWTAQSFKQMQTNGLGILTLTIIGPVLEELLFRGAITQELAKRFKPTETIIISGVIFGLFHINPSQVVAASLLGFLLAWIYSQSKSLIPCVLIHILNNSISVWLTTNYPETETLVQLMGEPAYTCCLFVALLLLSVSLWKIKRLSF